MKIDFDWKIGIWGWIVIAILLASLVLARILPGEMGWENGVIENTQVGILILGGIFSIIFSTRSKETKEKLFWYAVAAIFVFAIARELSWGRVFFPIGEGPEGPVFKRTKDIFNKTALHAGIGIYICVVLCLLLITAPWKKIRKIKMPAGLILLFMVCLLFNNLGERGMCMSYTHSEGQIIEEIAELMAYITGISLICYYRREFRCFDWTKEGESS